MQDVLTYEAWLAAVCHICNSLLKANVSIVGDEFKVVASKYRWVAYVHQNRIRSYYNIGWEPSFAAIQLMYKIIEQWDELLIEEDVK